MDFEIGLLMAFMLPILVAIIVLAVVHSRSSKDNVGYLYIDIGDRPEQIYLQLTKDIEDVKKYRYVTLTIDMINSHKEHSV